MRLDIWISCKQRNVFGGDFIPSIAHRRRARAPFSEVVHENIVGKCPGYLVRNIGRIRRNPINH